MTASSASSDPSAKTPDSSDEELSSRLDHLRALHSAWGVLAPAGIGGQGEEIAETGRALTEHLTSIVQSNSDLTPAAVQGIDQRLDSFETSIRQIAAGLPVAKLRLTLRNYRNSDRRGLLDLLDVLLGSVAEHADTLHELIFTLDYLITMLCTRPDAESAVIAFDPVTLTPRLEALTQRVDDPADPQIAEVESEFFAASNLDAEDLREELQMRSLRGRKSELGLSFFSPRVLRAIVTYNAAVLARVNSEIFDSTDWGRIEGVEAIAEAPAEARTSVFDSVPLRTVADAVRRRASGDEAEPTPLDRMAWALDFDSLVVGERSALRNEALGTVDDLVGTAILIGLLNRSVAVLAIELQDVGLSPDEISDDWVDEMRTVFQGEINRHIADDAYKVACALSELKSKFLLDPIAEQHRALKAIPSPTAPSPAQSVAPAAPPPQAPAQKAETARDLVMDALKQNQDAKPGSSQKTSWDQIPWARIAGGFAAVAAATLLGLFLALRGNPDLDGLSTDQLAKVSPYLAEGQRDGQGNGLSFVGKVDARWLELPADLRMSMADEIVVQLRAQGVRQIMIYDQNQHIRIQALGSQPTQTL